MQHDALEKLSSLQSQYGQPLDERATQFSENVAGLGASPVGLLSSLLVDLPAVHAVDEISCLSVFDFHSQTSPPDDPQLLSNQEKEERKRPSREERRVESITKCSPLPDSFPE